MCTEYLVKVSVLLESPFSKRKLAQWLDGEWSSQYPVAELLEIYVSAIPSNILIYPRNFMTFTAKIFLVCGLITRDQCSNEGDYTGQSLLFDNRNCIARFGASSTNWRHRSSRHLYDRCAISTSVRKNASKGPSTSYSKRWLRFYFLLKESSCCVRHVELYQIIFRKSVKPITNAAVIKIHNYNYHFSCVIFSASNKFMAFTLLRSTLLATSHVIGFSSQVVISTNNCSLNLFVI